MPQKNALTSANMNQMITSIIERGSVSTSEGVAPENYSPEESAEFIDRASAQMGPEVASRVAEVSMGIVETYLESNGIDPEDFWGAEDDLEVDAPDDVEVAPRGQPVVPVKSIKSDVASTMIVASALSRGGAVALPNPNIKMHAFTQIARTPAAVSMAKNLFGLFPCFHDLGNTGPNQMRVALDLDVNLDAPRADQMKARQMIAMIGAAKMADEKDVDAIGRWVKDNGLALGANTISIPTGIDGYQAKILFAVSEDETFLFVEESVGLGDYAFNDQTGEFSLTVKPGKTIQNGDILTRINLDANSGSFDGLLPGFPDDSGLTLFEDNNGTYAISYTGMDPLVGGDTVHAIFGENAFDPDAVALKEKLFEKLDPMGTLEGERGAGAPIDARYIYRWPGGRAHYEKNPQAVQTLSQLMAAKGSIEVTFNRSADLARIQALETAKKAPAVEHQKTAEDILRAVPEAAPLEDEKVQTVDEKPITRPLKASKQVVSSDRMRPLALMRSELGAEVRMVANPSSGRNETAAVFATADGFLAVMPDDGKSIAMSRSFVVEQKAELLKEGVEVARISADMDAEEFIGLVRGYCAAGGPTP